MMTYLQDPLKGPDQFLIFDFYNNEIGNEEVADLAERLKSCSGLKQLSLRSNRIEHEGAVALAKILIDHSELQKLNLTDNQIGLRGAVALAKSLKNHSSLLELVFCNNHIGDEVTVALAESLKNHLGLKILDLRNNQIGDEGAVALAKNLKKHLGLEILQLANNQIGNEGAFALAESLKNHSELEKYPDIRSGIANPRYYARLQHLDLANNQIGDEGAVALAESLKNHHSLQHLGLTDNQIGEIAIINLLELIINTSLASIDLSGNYNEDTDIEEAKNSLPKVKITDPFEPNMAWRVSSLGSTMIDHLSGGMVDDFLDIFKSTDVKYGDSEVSKLIETQEYEELINLLKDNNLIESIFKDKPNEISKSDFLEAIIKFACEESNPESLVTQEKIDSNSSNYILSAANDELCYEDCSDILYLGGIT